MLFKIPASFAEVIEVGGETEVGRVVPELFEALGWTKVGALTADVRVNIWSWGERVSVHDLGNGRWSVESKCRFPMQVVDWGKNRQNVEAFRETVSARLLEAGGPA